MPEIADRIPGGVILASYSNQIRDRAVMRYADATARDASVPLPLAGEIAYLTVAGKFQIYDGTNWVDFIDTRGGQTITGRTYLGSVTLNDGFLEFLGANQRILRNAVEIVDPNHVDSEAPGEAPTWRYANDIELGSGFEPGQPAENPEAAVIVNSGEEISTPRLRLKARSSTLHTIGPVQGQLALVSGALALDSANPLRLSAPTSTVGNNVLYSSTNRDWNGQLSSDTFRELRFSSSSGEQFKTIIDAPMTKAHSHHPINLLDVEFKRWKYKAGYLEADDARVGGEYLAPTADSMAEAYPWAVDNDADGTPMNLNQKILIEGLLWHVQDLTKRVAALESNKAEVYG